MEKMLENSNEIDFSGVLYTYIRLIIHGLRIPFTSNFQFFIILLRLFSHFFDGILQIHNWNLFFIEMGNSEWFLQLSLNN